MIGLTSNVLKDYWARKYEADLERSGRFLAMFMRQPLTDRPRLRLRHGIWVCSIPGTLVLGHGYTPREAYANWKRTIVRKDLTP